MVKQCIRKNGKATLPVNVARSILEARGVDIPVEDGRIRALLREKHLSVDDAKTATPHQDMRSELDIKFLRGVTYSGRRITQGWFLVNLL
jgi:hypothetical protein